MDFATGDFMASRSNDSPSPMQMQDVCPAAAKVVLGQIIEHYGLPACCLAFETPMGMSIKGNHGIDTKFVEHPEGGKSILFHGVDRNLPIIIYDALNDARYCHDALVVGPPHVRFFIGVPIMLSPTVRVGTLCLMDTEPRKFYSLKDCRVAMQGAAEIAQCLDEASRTSAHFARTLDMPDSVPALSSLRTI